MEDKAFITPIPEDPIKALRGILKGKPSIAKALVEERKEEVKREEEIAARFFRHSGVDAG